MKATPIRRGDLDRDLIDVSLRLGAGRLDPERGLRARERERDEPPPLPGVLWRGGTCLSYGAGVPVNSPVAEAKPGSDRVSGLLARVGVSFSPMPRTSATM